MPATSKARRNVAQGARVAAAHLVGVALSIGMVAGRPARGDVVLGDVTVSDDTTWAADTYHVANLAVENGATLTIAGGSVLDVSGTVAVADNGTIVLESVNVDGQVNGDWKGIGVTLAAGDVEVSLGSAISADGQGYTAGQGPGAGQSNQGADAGGGGGHGGRGGAGGGSNGGGTAYGAALSPTDLGSGGGDSQTAGGRGGGSTTLHVSDTLTLNGTISADGAAGVNAGCPARAGGGGAGGSLSITTGTLSGAGTFTARGGPGGGGGCGGRGGGGAGGRIAVSYATDAGFSGFTTATVSGGSGEHAGAAGTLAFINTSTRALRVSQNLALPPDSVLSVVSVTVDNGATLSMGGGSTLTVQNALTVTGSSTLVFGGKNTDGQMNGQWHGMGATVSAGDVTIDAGSRLSADGQGYDAEQGPGAGQSNDGIGGGGGGGHGGDGGASGDNVNPGGRTYGDALAPIDLGSGGGAARTVPGAGGGSVQLTVAGTLRLDGEISANGTGAEGGGCVGGNPAAGGGAGGSIFVTAGTLTGSGSMTATGGAGGDGGCFGGSDDGGGGAGGRIAVYYGVDQSFAGLTSSTVRGGAGGHSGAAGTLAFIDTSTNALRVSQSLAFPADSALTFGALSVENGAVLTIGGGSTLAIETALTVTGNATLLLEGTNTTAQVDERWRGSGVTIEAASAQIDAGSTVSADGEGYAAGQGPGAGEFDAGPFGGGGGAHGGLGGASGDGFNAGGLAYDALLAPSDLGSGGGMAQTAPGSGGGAVRLNVAGSLRLDGTISANGRNAEGGGCVGGNPAAGGGAGGSIFVTAGTLTGSGSITANGGAGGDGGCFGLGDDGGGGAGGRIVASIWESNGLAPDAFAADGGNGGTPGQAGSVRVETSPVFAWAAPSSAFAHGVERLRWVALGVDPASLTVDVGVDGASPPVDLDRGRAAIDSLDWDTTTVADGTYELRAVFHNASSAVVGTATHGIAINNSVTWHAGRLAADETWGAGSIHVVEAPVFIPPGVTLTIEAGAIVKFADATELVVERDGDLEAPASHSGRITFTSLEDDERGGDTNLDGHVSAPVAGAWSGIPVQGSGRVNLTNFVDIRYACAGDCNADGAVTINELVTSVNLALGNSGVSCTAGDANQDGQVTVNEVVAAVNHALNGCS